MTSVELAVTRIEQRPGLCGAATAQMILNFKGLVDTSEAEQLRLWDEIQQNTGSRRPRGDVRPHDCPSWPTQDCTRCRGETTFTCWCTHPAALETTLRDHGQPVTLIAHQTDVDATTAVLRSVDAVTPPAVLVQHGLHWLAVAGYLETAPHAAGAREIDGRWISEIFVRNPAIGAANQSVSIRSWMNRYASPVVQCGSFRNRQPVIAAIPRAAPGPRRRAARKRRRR